VSISTDAPSATAAAPPTAYGAELPGPPVSARSSGVEEASGARALASSAVVGEAESWWCVTVDLLAPAAIWASEGVDAAAAGVADALAVAEVEVEVEVEVADVADDEALPVPKTTSEQE
jgi:hypothetical protein